MKISALVAVLALSLAFANQSSADVVIGSEDFDGGATNLSGTTNVGNFPGLGGDFQNVFGIVAIGNMPRAIADDTVASVSGGPVNPGDTIGIIGQQGTSIFAMDNMDSVGSGLNNAVWSFDISAGPAITNVQMDIGAMGNFNNGQGFVIEAQIDGGGYQSIFVATPDTGTSNFAYRAMDDGDVTTLDNPMELFIDGAAVGAAHLNKADAATGVFDTYTSTLFAGQTGSTMDIRLRWTGNPLGGKPAGIDNIVINGVPEPGTCGLLGLMTLGLVAGRRRRK